MHKRTRNIFRKFHWDWFRFCMRFYNLNVQNLVLKIWKVYKPTAVHSSAYGMINLTYFQNEKENDLKILLKKKKNRTKLIWKIKKHFKTLFEGLEIISNQIIIFTFHFFKEFYSFQKSNHKIVLFLALLIFESRQFEQSNA